jgi:cyclic pyranopterin phosphate synthase
MIYGFEEIDETLDLVPLAARRALDSAGYKLSLDSWRKLALTTRRVIVAAGAEERMDTNLVREALTRADTPLETIEPPDEPRADRVPAELETVLGSTITEETWRFLSPLDRYALAKVARKGPSPKLLRALTEMVVVPEPRGLSTHLSSRGEARMVDVGDKPSTLRRAIAHAHVAMQVETAARIRAGSTPKGDVLAAARIAGIQAAKRTPDLIPLCHVVALTRVAIDIHPEEGGLAIVATAEARDRTGVEMEALVAASTAALTIYDMLKSIDRAMTIQVRLQEKSGGRSGSWQRESS